MKICFVSGVISRSGGTERVGIMIANELARRGYDVSILSFWNQGKPFFACEKSVNIYYLLNSNTEGKLYHTLLYPVIKMRRFIKKHKFDVVIDIDTVLSYYTLRAIKGIEVKHIAWEHFNHSHTMQDKRRLDCIKMIREYSNQLLVLTQQDYKLHVDKEGFREDKISYIYNPTPFEGRKKSSRNSKIFLAVGRLTAQKGFDLMLESWKYVEKELDEWRLIIVGSGEDEQKLNDIIEQNSLSRVELIPETDNIEFWYNKASLYVMSSRYEGFPMVLLEAMAKAIPIISFDCITGPSELVQDGKTGVLVECGDYLKLAYEMVNLAKDQKRQDDYANASLEVIKNFHISHIGEKWELLINKVMNQGNK